MSDPYAGLPQSYLDALREKGLGPPATKTDAPPGMGSVASEVQRIPARQETNTGAERSGTASREPKDVEPQSANARPRHRPQTVGPTDADEDYDPYYHRSSWLV